MNNQPAHRLLILACSATKTSIPGWTAAIDRYNGPLWQTLRAIAPDRRHTKAAVLSARYGFIDSRSPIEHYDSRLTKDLAKRMIAGGITTRWPRPPSPRKSDNYGNHAGCEIAPLTDHGDRPFTDVGLAGSHLYLEVMHGFVGEFRARGYITGDAGVTEINGPIGFMRQDLRAWLQADRGEIR